MENHTAAEEAWRALLRTNALVVDAIEHELQQCEGMPLTWLEVLARLAETPLGSLRMQDLADRLVLSRSGVTRLVDRMEAAGLIERASCPSDRRGTNAVLTAAGRSALERQWPLLGPAIDKHFGRHMSDAEADQIRSALGKVLDAHGYDANVTDCAAGDAVAEETSER